VDFILADGVPWILEVNPRPGASLDLYEKVCGFNGFQMHVEAIRGRLPRKPSYGPHKAAARGIIYARQDVVVLDHPRWLSGRYGDIPHPDEVIPAGAPICSIYSESNTALRCWEDILARANEPYEMVLPL
jgi:uncharacterized protein